MEFLTQAPHRLPPKYLQIDWIQPQLENNKNTPIYLYL